MNLPNTKKYQLDTEKEFDELVKLQQNLSRSNLNSIENLFNLFGSQSKEMPKKYKPLFDLSENQYIAVVNASNALAIYGESEVGKKVYQNNKLAYFVSKKFNSLLEKV